MSLTSPHALRAASRSKSPVRARTAISGLSPPSSTVRGPPAAQEGHELSGVGLTAQNAENSFLHDSRRVWLRRKSAAPPERAPSRQGGGSGAA
jgi:hypothetical protein